MGVDVAERLRGLESRLEVLSGSRTIDIQPLRQAFAGHEARRGKQYAEALRQAGGFALDVRRGVDERLETALSGVADRAIAVASEQRFPVAGLDHERAAGQEPIVLEMLERFGALQRASQEQIDQLGAAVERVDEIWKQQEAVGNWRVAMRAVREQVELETRQGPGFTELAGTEPVVAKGLQCERCRYWTVRRIQRQSLMEEAMRMLALAPYRCATCGTRSYHFKWAAPKAG